MVIFQKLGGPGDIRDDAELIVHEHERNEHGVIAKDRGNLLRRYATVGTRFEPAHLPASRLEPATRVYDRLVLDRGGDQVAAQIFRRKRDALNGQVVRLRCPGRPHHFPRIARQQRSDFDSRLLHGLLRIPTVDMRTRRRIAEDAIRREMRDDTLGHARIHGRGCRVVEINRQAFGHEEIVSWFLSPTGNGKRLASS